MYQYSNICFIIWFSTKLFLFSKKAKDARLPEYFASIYRYAIIWNKIWRNFRIFCFILELQSLSLPIRTQTIRRFTIAPFMSYIILLILRSWVSMSRNMSDLKKILDLLSSFRSLRSLVLLLVFVNDLQEILNLQKSLTLLHF